MPKTVKISGPPGTGKTSYLLKQIENACTKYDPNQIGAVSFSKAAVEEMRDRVHKVLGLRGHAADNIRTIHSHCFKLLGLVKEQVAEERGSLINEWNEAYPHWSMPAKALTQTDLEDEPTEAPPEFFLQDNVRRFLRMQILRNRMLPEAKWHDEEALAMGRAWIAWLRENEYYDFTMMLEDVLARKLCPDIRVLFIDEAQDLSTLQIAVARMWAEQCDTAIFIGDSDQSLYRFSGAVPEDFRDLPHEWGTVLKQSYRVPVAVHEYAMELINQIGDNREQVEYLPTSDPGLMEYDHYLPNLSLPGTHMILCRCNYQLKRWLTYLTRKGIPWHNPYRSISAWNPTGTKLWRAVQIYDTLAKGLDVYQDDMIDLIAAMKVAGNMNNGIKSSRKKLVQAAGTKFDVFSLSTTGWFTPEFLQFNRPLDQIFSMDGQAGALLAASNREIVRTKPHVITGTIHSVKGGEADHVWVDLTSTATIERAAVESETAYDDEVRVAYVAVTRARQSCHLLQPNGLRNGVFL